MLENSNMEMDIDIEDLAKIVEDEPKEVKQPEPTMPNPVSKTNLEWYYRNLFPFKHFFKWLGLDSSLIFDKREFTFTLENDIYCRFLSFKDEEEFKKEALRALPIKIDIGAIYNTQPKYNKSVSLIGDSKGLVPEKKEMIFDIDMTDYDDVRTCCKQAKMCNKCWKYMVIAYKILNFCLTEDFGFEHIMWVFSGRRGIHCWVSDERAKNLTNDGRSAIANYIRYRVVNTQVGIKTTLKEPLHPSLERSLSIIEEHFEEYILRGQDILNDKEINKLIIMIIKAHFNYKQDFETTENTINRILASSLDSVSKWNAIYKELVITEKAETTKLKRLGKYSAAELCFKEIKLNITYPRLDINVSKHINHLLKSPFCVHPKTGLISVPLNENDIVNFDINNIPSIESSIDDFRADK